MNFFERLQSLDRRVIYLFLALAIALPLLFPLGLPFSVGAEVRDSYDYIEENVNPGDLILFSFDISTGSMPELGPITTSTVAHLAAKGARLIGIATHPDGPMLAWGLMEPFAEQIPYGDGWVNLGLVAGGEAGVQAFLENPRSVFTKDMNETPVDQIPVMADFQNVEDLKMIISINCGPTGGASVVQWVRVGYTTNRKPVWIGLNAVMAPGSMPYYKSGQLTGYIAGIRGAAEYEKLIERPALATSAMDAQSMAHGLIILFIILGNVGMLVAKPPKPGEGR